MKTGVARDDARRNEVLLSEELAELKEKLRNSQLDKVTYIR